MSVYDRIISPKNFAALIELETLTNPRMREERVSRKVRAQDAIHGADAVPVMASFAYSGNSRFTDGSYGVYYAAKEEPTAIAESRYHTEAFLRATNEPSIDVDKRVYVAAIKGAYEDLRSVDMSDARYDPDSYVASQRFARDVYEENVADGIVYKSVRRSGGHCICAFRPRLISRCRVAKYIQFRWDGSKIAAVATITEIRDLSV